MAKNEVFKEANYLSLPVATGALSGSAVRVGGLNGVLSTNEGSVDKGSHTYDTAASANLPGYASVALIGAFRLNVTVSKATAVGDPVYITSTGVLNDTATGNSLFGYSLTAQTGTSGSKSLVVRIAN